MARPDARPPTTIRCLACGEAFDRLVAPRIAAAIAAVALGDAFACVTVCGDDLGDGADGWLQLQRPTGGDPRPGLVLYCAPGVFADLRRDAVEPGPADWQQAAAPREEATLPAERFVQAEADAFLHHQLALAADLLGGRLLPDLVPPSLAEAFAAAWDVAIDGRLSRAGLPGLSQARRRGRFSRRFSAAGVLMPGHWQIFQALWDGALATQGEVLAAVRRLPRLQGGGGPGRGA